MSDPAPPIQDGFCKCPAFASAAPSWRSCNALHSANWPPSRRRRIAAPRSSATPIIVRNDKNLQQLLDVKQLNSDLEASAGIAAQLADTGVLKKPKTLDCSGPHGEPGFKQEPA